MRGDAGEFRLHAFEQRTFGAGLDVVERQAMARVGHRIDDRDRGTAGRQQILPGLVEELIG
jgi:hypothetical protein